MVAEILEQRAHLEDEIRKLGGTLPPRWPHDNDGQYRNLQLLEHLEDLRTKSVTKP